MPATQSHKEDIHCPDPSVHSRLSRDSDLQNSASKAALLAASSQSAPQAQKQQQIEALGPDGRLSAAGAATSLKYAKAQDLPSFPSVGIETSGSGNKAANLANSNQKSFEWWKPEASSSAGKAALLAHKDGAKVEPWRYNPDGTGNSAANIAMGIKSSPQIDYGYTEDGHKKALLAATASLKIKDTPPTRQESASPLYPDAENSQHNALNAATIAHKPSTRSNDPNRMSERAMEASRFTHAKGISRDMYGDKPPVSIEEEEKRHQAALRASAVSMAKSLYEIEKPHMEKIAAGDAAARKVYADQYSDRPSSSGDDLKIQAMNYMKVQEAAQKLAAERLAKLDPDGVLAYKEHYGYAPQGQRSRFSIRRHNRNRSGSQEDVDSSDDEFQAAKIKSQMSQFNAQVAAVDNDKRNKDRESLLAAAQRSVQARMHAMDEKVFAETGKASPAMQEEWEAKARAKAAADSESRMQNHGKVHIGGGQYMDQSEIEAIAAARMQPTLDEISKTADLQRARDLEVKMDQQRRAEENKIEKERQAELKRVQNEQKAAMQREREAERAEQRRLKEEEKAEQRRQKDDEKRAKADAKDADKELERLRREKLTHEQEAEKARQAEAEAAERERLATERLAEVEQTPVSPTAGGVTSNRVVTSTETDRSTELSTSPTSPSSPRQSKIKGLFSRIKRTSKSGSAPVAVGSTSTTSNDPVAEAEKFKHGTGEGEESAELSERAKGKQPESISTLASSDDEEEVTRGRTSTLSNDNWEEARDQFDDSLNPPRASFTKESVSGSSPSRSKFQEDL